jgi:hypothetical protein
MVGHQFSALSQLVVERHLSTPPLATLVPKVAIVEMEILEEWVQPMVQVAVQQVAANQVVEAEQVAQALEKMVEQESTPT